MDLNTSIRDVSRSYKMYASRLEKLGIFKLEDFLFHIPFRYDDFSHISKISELTPGEIVTVKGEVVEIENKYIKKWKTLQKAKIKDDTGILDLLWFNQPFIPKGINKGDIISVSGKVEDDGYKTIIKSPDYEVIYENKTIHTGRLVPVYPETRGVSSKWLRRQVFKLISELENIEEYLPENILNKNNLLNLKSAISQIHFPNSLENAEKAKKRLAFNELLEMQLSSIVRKNTWSKKILKKPWETEKYKSKIENLIKDLPFTLTNAQLNAITDILKDLKGDKAMNRLLEGDVGSGKTIVAAIASFVAVLNDHQVALMAPTEILANQHFQTLQKILGNLKIKIELATGSTKKINQDFDILIGTHALVYNKVKFKKLGLIVIDEQQRFGVEQRSTLREKGESPHLLTMTATPIPRTVALTLYGDLDLSILDEMPKGRQLIKTWLVPPTKREGAYKWIEEKIVKNKDQVFIVCPFIEESESMITVKAASKEFERLKKEVFPKLKLGLLHGKLKAKEKNEILKKFKEGKFDILVSTPVVEVGIDIPNATIMVIEEAERFGLAQLHQLRGRVGRGVKESFCILFTSSKNPLTLKRLKSMEEIYSGAKLAELDLQLRGAGQMHGTMQHGAAELKVANFSDFELIDKTKKVAEELFTKLEELPKLKAKIDLLNSKKVSPD